MHSIYLRNSLRYSLNKLHIRVLSGNTVEPYHTRFSLVPKTDPPLPPDPPTFLEVEYGCYMIRLLRNMINFYYAHRRVSIVVAEGLVHIWH